MNKKKETSTTKKKLSRSDSSFEKKGKGGGMLSFHQPKGKGELIHFWWVKKRFACLRGGGEKKALHDG